MPAAVLSQGLRIDTNAVSVYVTFCDPGIVRVRRDLKKEFHSAPGPAVVLDDGQQFDLTEAEDSFICSTPALRVTLDRLSASLCFTDPDGKSLLSQPDDPVTLRKTQVFRSDFSKGTATQVSGADGEHITVSPLGKVPDREAIRVWEAFQLSPSEALFGLGSHEEGYGNLRGKKRLLYQHNLKACVPVLVSTRGWAILWNMGCLITFDSSDSGFSLEAACADQDEWYFLYGGGSYEGLMQKYRLLTGSSSMLPKYALGYTQSKERYMNAQELQDTVKEYRRRRIPLDMIVQDWMSWPDGQWGFKAFDPARFPHGFTDELHRLNARVMVSIWPNMQGERNDDRDAMVQKGFMLGNGSTYNAFLPEARELYWKQARDRIFSENTDAWWCDCSEPFESDWHGETKPDEPERAQINTSEAGVYLDPVALSLYSLYHARGIWEGQHRDAPDKRVLNLTRSSWAGQHRYATVTWSGDVSATWETLRRHIPEGLNFFATGEPYWSCDIGAFFVKSNNQWFWKGEYPLGAEDPAYRELFTRWMQYGAFLTSMRAHGTDTPREIWHFGEEGGMYYDAIARAIRLRSCMVPFMYSLMAETRFTGTPAVRVPALVFPEDPALYDETGTMLIGNSLLVSPVTHPMYHDENRQPVACPDTGISVYLPAGHNWYEPETGKTFPGGQTAETDAPIGVIPLFIRSGGILLLGPVRQYVSEPSEEPLSVLVIPGEDGAFPFYDDAGDGSGYENGEYEQFRFIWNDREKTLLITPREGTWPGMPMQRKMLIRVPGLGEKNISYLGKELRVRFA